jgi:hypothetical protein
MQRQNRIHKTYVILKLIQVCLMYQYNRVYCVHYMTACNAACDAYTPFLVASFVEQQHKNTKLKPVALIPVQPLRMRLRCLLILCLYLHPHYILTYVGVYRFVYAPSCCMGKVCSKCLGDVIHVCNAFVGVVHRARATYYVRTCITCYNTTQ